MAEPQTKTEENASMTEAVRLFSEQNFDGAEKICSALLQENPSHGDALNLMGGIFARRGQIDKAIEYIGKAYAAAPHNARYLGNLAKMYMAKNERDKAVQLMMQAVVMDPENKQHRMDLSFWFKGYSLEGGGKNDVAKQALTICLKDRELITKLMQMPWISLLAREDSFALFGKITSFPDYQSFKSGIDQASLAGTLNEPVLLTGLPVIQASYAPLETAMTRLRHYLLDLHNDTNDPGALSPYTNFLCALGMQCFLNEYIYSILDDEKEKIEALKQKIAALDLKDQSAPGLIALYACYYPLKTLDREDALARVTTNNKNDLFEALLTRQIIEPRAEATLKKNIPVLTEISDEISEIVRAQYEENPYPRWHSWPPPQPHALARRDNEGKTILNAGCGTGQEAISAAAAYPYAQFTAVDLSLSSLAYAMRKADEIGLKNIKFGQADILKLDAWKEKFDVIMSSGVLHHLREPLEGWKVLTTLLKPGGVMKVALYSELGRQSEIACQNWIKENNIPATDEGIYKFRDYIYTLDDSDPMKAISKRNDFYSTSSCRDLCFHVMEHRFSALEIDACLDELGFKFLGFQDLPGTVKQKFAQQFPDDPAMISLWNWHKFETQNPETFASMFTLWCCRKEDRPEGGLPEWLQTPLP